MRIALRDMQPWRRALLEAGLSFEWVAAQTGRSVHTVQAYSSGTRRAPEDWVARVEQLAREALQAPR